MDFTQSNIMGWSGPMISTQSHESLGIVSDASGMHARMRSFGSGIVFNANRASLSVGGS